MSGTAVFAGVSLRGLPTPGLAQLYRSLDFGKSWTPANNGLPSGVANAFVSLGSNIFLAINKQVYVSANGDRWQSASSGLPADTEIITLAASGTNLYAGTFGKGVYGSTNNGQSWTELNANLPKNAAIRSLLADGSNLFAISPTDYDTACPAGGIFIDGTCFGVLLPGGSGFFDIDLLFGNLGSGKIYFSPNLGRSWAPIAAGLNEAPATAIGAGGGTVFAGSRGSGVFGRKF